jgi:NAD(P)H-binding
LSSGGRILVIGATGKIGRHVASQLAAGTKVRALVRKPDVAHLPAEIELAQGDLTIPESLDGPLADVDAVFLVWTAPSEFVISVLQRIANKAQRESSNLQWTFLRPGMFAANALRWWAPQIQAGNLVRCPYLAAPTAPIDERDIASIAVHALREDRHMGAEYCNAPRSFPVTFSRCFPAGCSDSQWFGFRSGASPKKMESVSRRRHHRVRRQAGLPHGSNTR